MSQRIAAPVRRMVGVVIELHHVVFLADFSEGVILIDIAAEAASFSLLVF